MYAQITCISSDYVHKPITSVKFQRNHHNTCRSCAHKGPTNLYFISVNSRKTTKLKLPKKVIKINQKINIKPHAHVQSMVKTSVKFQMNRNNTAGGVAHIRYILLQGDRRTEGEKDGHTEGRKAENYVPPLFPEKAGDNKK